MFGSGARRLVKGPPSRDATRRLVKQIKSAAKDANIHLLNTATETFLVDHTAREWFEIVGIILLEPARIPSPARVTCSHFGTWSVTGI
jgi:hypothetical protein